MVILCPGFASPRFARNCLWVLMGTSLQRGWHVAAHHQWINALLAGLTIVTIMFWYF